ncbi:MAG: type II secretion system GspH family protein [Gammaproteobacteria bacterium]|nr:type II secretion system GspH family protein [Gammaproteobacteria bacterium]
MSQPSPILPAKSQGFTLIEMAMVLVIVGILLSMTLPIVRGMVQNSKHNAERNILEETRSALIGYAFIHGGFPDPLANDVVPAGQLGVRATGPYAKPFLYDVNSNLLASTTGGDIGTFCAAVHAEQTASAEPMTWHGTDFSNPVNSSPQAFVLVSQGANYRTDRENKPLGDGTLTDRIYENSATAEANNYDDAVASYSLVQLKNDCLKIAAPPVVTTTCAAVGDARCAEFTNKTGQNVYYAVGKDWNATLGRCELLADDGYVDLGMWDKDQKLFVVTALEKDNKSGNWKCDDKMVIVEKRLKDIDSSADPDLMATAVCQSIVKDSCALY